MELEHGAEIFTGVTFRKRESTRPSDLGKWSLIKISDIHERGEIQWESVSHVSTDEVQEGASQILRSGDILLASRGAHPTASVYEGQREPAIAGIQFNIIRPYADQIDSHYLAYVLNSPWMQKRLKQLSEGTDILMISVKKLREIEVPVPDRETQFRIRELYTLQLKALRLEQKISDLKKRETDYLLEQYLQQKVSPL